MSFLR